MPGCHSPGSAGRAARASLASAVGAAIPRQSPSPRPACLHSTAAENSWILPQDAPSECENSSSARSHSNCSLATQPHLLFSSLCSCVRPPRAAHEAAAAATGPAAVPGPQIHHASTLNLAVPFARSPTAVVTLTLLTPCPRFQGLSLGLRRQCSVLPQGPPLHGPPPHPRKSNAQHPEGSRTLTPAPQHTRDIPGGAVLKAKRSGVTCPKGNHSRQEHPNGTRPCTCHGPAPTKITQQKPLRATRDPQGSASTPVMVGSPSPSLQDRSTSPGTGVPAPLLLTATNPVRPAAALEQGPPLHSSPPLTRQ